MATPHPLNKPSGQPQLPHKPRSLAVQSGQAFPCFHLPELLFVGYTQGYGAARAEYVLAHLAFWLLVQAGARSPAKERSLPATASGKARSIRQS